MSRTFSEQERQQLDLRVAETEKRTGAQVVCAVVDRSDVYAELPWKAFALGASVSGAIVFLLDLLRQGWASPAAVLIAVITTLASGATCALLCVWVPTLARLLLDARRAEVEVRQYAESLFLSRELFATRNRTGVLLFISLFERRVAVLPDTGLATSLAHDNLQKITAGMAAALSAGHVSRALEQGLAGLEDVLAPTAAGRSRENEITESIIEEKGQ